MNIPTPKPMIPNVPPEFYPALNWILALISMRREREAIEHLRQLVNHHPQYADGFIDMLKELGLTQVLIDPFR
ncbi:MAG: hypothetical protein P9M14_13005 [Candidatus Alcyoniella australis]|nr:hypothetical protein [Candidatus Alcyoniella australis]